MNRFEPGDKVHDLKTGQWSKVVEVDYGLMSRPDEAGLGYVTWYGREPRYRIGIGLPDEQVIWRYGDELYAGPE